MCKGGAPWQLCPSQSHRLSLANATGRLLMEQSTLGSSSTVPHERALHWRCRQHRSRTFKNLPRLHLVTLWHRVSCARAGVLCTKQTVSVSPAANAWGLMTLGLKGSRGHLKVKGRGLFSPLLSEFHMCYSGLLIKGEVWREAGKEKVEFPGKEARQSWNHHLLQRPFTAAQSAPTTVWTKVSAPVIIPGQTKLTWIQWIQCLNQKTPGKLQATSCVFP